MTLRSVSSPPDSRRSRPATGFPRSRPAWSARCRPARVPAGRLGRARFSFGRDTAGDWIGLDGYFAGEPVRKRLGPDGRVVALDLASLTYTRMPYDQAAPVPGRVDSGGWR